MIVACSKEKTIECKESKDNSSMLQSKPAQNSKNERRCNQVEENAREINKFAISESNNELLRSFSNL